MRAASAALVLMAALVIGLPVLDPAAEMAKHRFLFIVGINHSGTSLFKLLWGRHPDATDMLGVGTLENEGQFGQTVYPVGLTLFASCERRVLPFWSICCCYSGVMTS